MGVRSFDIACTVLHRLFAIVVLISSVDAAPTIALPINAQVPPAARVSQPYSFAFSPSTFFSTSPLTYSLSNAPSWLSLDSASRTLSGTPPTSAANTAPIINIIATDSTGSVTMGTTLVISSNPAPTVLIPLADQISKFGNYTLPSSILTYPSTTFQYAFDRNTFSSSATNFYAVTLDNTPLPSWLNFDGSALTFSGKTPDSSSLVEPPQTFGVQFIGSDILGFGGAAINFEIVVTIHELEFSKGYILTSATVNQPFNSTSLRNSLQLDGASIPNNQIASVNAQAPSWLTFDNATYSLSGTPPSNAQSTNVTITVTDTLGDTAEAIVEISIITNNLFVGSVGSLNATTGSFFSHSFNSSFANSSDINLSAQISPTTSYLNFNPQNFTLTGEIPANVQPSTIQITLQAVSKSTQATDNQVVALNVVSATASTTPTSSSGLSTSSAASTASSASSAIPSATVPASVGPAAIPTPTSPVQTAPNLTGASSSNHGLTKGQLAAAIAVPIIVVLLAALLCLFCCCFRRKRRERPVSPEKQDISNPILYYTKPRTLSDPEHPANRIPAHYGVPGSEASDVSSADPHAVTMPGTYKHQVMPGVVGSRKRSQRDPAHLRQASDNTSSFDGSSWLSGQDGVYPTLSNIGSAVGPGQITRNFSRKPFVAGLPRSETANTLVRRSMVPSGVQSPPADFGNKRQKRRTPDYIGEIPNIGSRRSGIGHGSRPPSSLSSSERAPSRAGGIGHGHVRSSESGDFGPPAWGRVRHSSSWQTVQTGNTRPYRPQSGMSVLTESTDVLDTPAIRGKSLRMVPKSPAVGAFRRRSSASSNSKFARPISRRTGDTAFFGGAPDSVTRSISKASSHKRFVYSDLDVPQMPPTAMTNDSLERSILAGLRDIPESRPGEGSRDPLGIRYGTTYESTKQLRSLVSSISQRLSWNRQSPIYNDQDSRFRSVEHSSDSHSGEKRLGMDDGEWEDDDFFDGRSPSSMPSFRDSEGNSIRYGMDESPELGEAEARPSLLAPFARWSNINKRTPPTRPSRDGSEVWSPGPARRPVSIQKEHDTRSQISHVASHYGRPSVDEEPAFL